MDVYKGCILIKYNKRGVEATLVVALIIKSFRSGILLLDLNKARIWKGD